MVEKLYIEDYQHILSRGKGGQVKVICPFCHERRSNKRDRSLSINLATLAYHCHYCETKGYLKSKMEENISQEQRYFKPQKKEYKLPKQEINQSEYSKAFIEYFNSRGISEKTLKDLRVSEEVEFFPQLQNKSRCIAFNYYLLDQLINVKYRTRNKDFKLVSGAKLIPYNIDSISEESFEDEEEKYAIITEGEFDALTYIECGLNHVVSVPNGASTNLEYLDDFIESHFDKLDYIYVSVDNDRKGVECRAELIRRLGKEKCRIIDYPSPCKDINEVLVQYGKDKVRECFKKYTELRIEGVDELIDVENELDYLFNNGLQRGTTVGIENIDNLISFQTGMLTVVTGVPSHGKTYYLNYLLSRLNILHNWKIAFFSPEFYPVNLHIAQIIETLGGNRFSNKNYSQQVYEAMKDYVCKNFFWLDPDDTDITSVLERAKYLIKKKGIKAFVIDPFNALTDKEKKNVKQDEYISEFLQKIRWFARKYDVAIFLVMHPTKMIKLENGLYPVCDLYNCKGASEIFDKSDIGITVWRNEQDDYAEMHITKVKFRHLGEKGHTSFKFNINNGRFVSIGDASMLKQNGTDTRTMSVDWDNRNWIVDKINGVYSKQNTLELGNNNQYENSSFDDLMNEQVGEVPF